MANKNFYMVIDTETCGNYVYDVAYQIIDKQGTVYQSESFLIKEFIDNPELLGMFNDIYCKDKIARYYYSLYSNEGKFTVANFDVVRANINNAITKFNARVCAYNIAFDLSHLKMTANYCGYSEFFNGEIEIMDIWNVALWTLCGKRYAHFCIENNLYAKKGSISSNAENVYRFLINDASFNEAHVAIDDVRIESEILVNCFSKHKKYEIKKVGGCKNNQAWIKLQSMK